MLLCWCCDGSMPIWMLDGLWMLYWFDATCMHVLQGRRLLITFDACILTSKLRGTLLMGFYVSFEGCMMFIRCAPFVLDIGRSGWDVEGYLIELACHGSMEFAGLILSYICHWENDSAYISHVKLSSNQTKWLTLFVNMSVIWIFKWNRK
jgi:hypothetical protein